MCGKNLEIDDSPQTLGGFQIGDRVRVTGPLEYTVAEFSQTGDVRVRGHGQLQYIDPASLTKVGV